MLTIAVGPSRFLSAALLSVHACAAAVLMPLELPFGAKAVCLAAIAVSLLHSTLRYGLLRTTRSIVALELSDDGRTVVHLREGRTLACTISGTSYVSAALTVLNLRPEGRRTRCHAVLVPDNVQAEDFRRLRVLLKWGKRDE